MSSFTDRLSVADVMHRGVVTCDVETPLSKVAQSWFVERYADLPDEKLGLRCEQAIRNHDPCISCATYFLQLEFERR